MTKIDFFKLVSDLQLPMPAIAGLLFPGNTHPQAALLRIQQSPKSGGLTENQIYLLCEKLGITPSEFFNNYLTK